MSRKERYTHRGKNEFNPRDLVPGLKVEVQDRPFGFEKAMKIFNKKVQDSGILRELREREFYEKPSVRRKKEKAIARKRWLKTLEEQQKSKRLY